MLKFLFLLTCLCLSIDAISQEPAALPFQPTLGLEKFINQKNFVSSVKVVDGYYDIMYYPVGSDDPQRIKIKVVKDVLFSITTFKWKPTVSIISVPFKVRPKIDSTSDQLALPQFATASLKNLGALVGIGFNKDAYLANGKTTNQKLLIGLLVSPSVEEFNLKNTNQKFEKESQLVLSTGITVTYTYNGVTFSIIPAGFDYGLTRESKDWVYNKRYWWGFGIGIDVKLAGFL